LRQARDTYRCERPSRRCSDLGQLVIRHRAHLARSALAMRDAPDRQV
jgi:hypothetical protein